MSEEETALLSAKICRNILKCFSEHREFIQHGIYGYYPHGKEVSLIGLYHWILEQKIPLAFPRVSGMDMEFYQVRSMEEFSEGSFHIMEPEQNCPLAVWDTSICLVPGSVFDKQGNRYGYGKGYYDRYFDGHQQLCRIGVAYEQQIEDRILTEPTDIKMDAVVTEDAWHFAHHSSRRKIHGITGDL